MTSNNSIDFKKGFERSVCKKQVFTIQNTFDSKVTHTHTHKIQNASLILQNTAKKLLP